MDLKTLIDRCRHGDDLAWELLVRRYQGRVFGFCLHYFRDREEARDAAQEVFIKIYGRLDSVNDTDTFLPWMLRLARNHCIDRIRRLKVRTPEIAVPIDSAPEIDSGEPSPEAEQLADERQRLVYEALGHLSEKNRELILLKDIQQMKLEEISDLLSLPINTVKSRSRRARLELAKVVQAIDPAFAEAAEQGAL